MSADDDELWQRLQGLTSRMDPVPGDVVTAAKQSLSWRDTETALASLILQTRVSGELAGVRGSGGPELLTFSADDVTVEIEVMVDGDVVSLTGQLVPPQPGRVAVDHPDGPAWAQVDELGRFSVTGIARGHLRLTCHPRQGGPIKTVWTLI